MYGLPQILKSLPIQNLDTILFYMASLNWRNICPEMEIGYSIRDFMALSPKSVFYNPDLYGADVPPN